MTNQTSFDSPKAQTLTKAILLALLLVIVDAFWLNQGAIAALVGIVLLFVRLPQALHKKNKPIRFQNFRNLGIYAFAVGMVFFLNAMNNRIAAERSEIIISAVKAYNQKYKHYPATLNELVPEFLNKIPLAKYTSDMNKFVYYVTDDNAYLFYVKFPPFGRQLYTFNENRKSHLD